MARAGRIAIPIRKITNQDQPGIPCHHSEAIRSRVNPPTPAIVIGTKQKNPKKYSQPVRNPAFCPSVRLVYVYAYPADAILRVKPITTNASARHAMPPTRKANGVDVPANVAANVVLYAMAMAGDRTATAIATASMVESV